MILQKTISCLTSNLIILTNITIKYFRINIVRINEILFNLGGETLEAININY